MVYTSSRQLGDLAYGLIEGTLDHYQEEATIGQQVLTEDVSQIEFMIVKQIHQPLTTLYRDQPV